MKVAIFMRSSSQCKNSLLNLAVQKGKKVVVMGSSFISMELVAAVSKRELASIDVIGMEEYPFEMVLGKEVGKGLKQVSNHKSGHRSALIPFSVS